MGKGKPAYQFSSSMTTKSTTSFEKVANGVMKGGKARADRDFEKDKQKCFATLVQEKRDRAKSGKRNGGCNIGLILFLICFWILIPVGLAHHMVALREEVLYNPSDSTTDSPEVKDLLLKLPLTGDFPVMEEMTVEPQSSTTDNPVVEEGGQENSGSDTAVPDLEDKPQPNIIYEKHRGLFSDSETDNSLMTVQGVGVRMPWSRCQCMPVLPFGPVVDPGTLGEGEPNPGLKKNLTDNFKDPFVSDWDRTQQIFRIKESIKNAPESGLYAVTVEADDVMEAMMKSVTKVVQVLIRDLERDVVKQVRINDDTLERHKRELIAEMEQIDARWDIVLTINYFLGALMSLIIVAGIVETGNEVSRLFDHILSCTATELSVMEPRPDQGSHRPPAPPPYQD